MVTRWLFTALVLAVLMQRILEARVSRRNARRLLAAGGRESARGQFRAMLVLHPAWIAAMLVEVWVLERQPIAWVAALGFIAFLAGQSLRLLAIRTLGPRWSARIITMPSAQPVTGGIYRYLRHPNYLGVVLEIAGLPLVHGAWLTAIVASLANALVLLFRIPAEEAALTRDNAYAAVFARKPRFIPWASPVRDSSAGSGRK